MSNRVQLKVCWYDNISGEGIAIDNSTGKDYHLYWGNFKNASPISKGGERIVLNGGDRIEASIYSNGVRTQIFDIIKLG